MIAAQLSTENVVELFAGPGGYSEGLALLGLPASQALGIEFNVQACATAEAAGHRRLLADVAALDPREIAAAHFTGPVTGFHASSPCQGFSMLGKGGGREDSANLLAWIDALELLARLGNLTEEEVATAIASFAASATDAKSALTLEPIRWIFALRPEWITFEQVPAVLPLWEAIGRLLTALGYSVATGNLHTEQYGVPQTRKRAILVASRVRTVQLPTATHSKFHSRTPARLDEGVLPWISMASALGWAPEDVVSIATARMHNQSGTAFDLSWPAHRPAPVIAGREIVTMPGANANRFNGRTKSRNDGLRVTASEAGVLQGFPSRYPWAGNKGQIFQQIGDAVPPPFAARVALAALGHPSTERTAA